jgi:hypothetical protein
MCLQTYGMQVNRRSICAQNKTCLHSEWVSGFPEIKRITFTNLLQDQNNNIILKSCQIIYQVEITKQYSNNVILIPNFGNLIQQKKINIPPCSSDLHVEKKPLK